MTTMNIAPKSMPPISVGMLIGLRDIVGSALAGASGASATTASGDGGSGFASVAGYDTGNVILDPCLFAASTRYSLAACALRVRLIIWIIPASPSTTPLMLAIGA